jgi:adenylate kinase
MLRVAAREAAPRGIWQAPSVRKYVIMGIQGSGKGTQAQRLAADFDLVHLSVGDVFRWNVEQHTKLGAQVRRIMAAGQLVDDELVEAIVRQRLQDHDWNYGFIIDGFPRNVRQAEFFLESYDIDAVILLELADEEVAARVLSRRICAGCGLDYNVVGRQPHESEVCATCGGELVMREDDNPDALAARLRDYHQKTQPIIELFERKECVLHIDAKREIGVIQSDIRRRLGLPENP